MSAVTPPYEPEVIERFAAQLDARGRSLQRGITITGALLGALVGAVPLTPLGDAWPIPEVFGLATLLAGLLCGGLIGFVVGSGRAELHRLHAQTVLCQLHAQRATLAIWKLLRDQEAAAKPEPAPEPRQIVAPVAPLAQTVMPVEPPPAQQPARDMAPPPLSIRSA